MCHMTAIINGTEKNDKKRNRMEREKNGHFSMTCTVHVYTARFFECTPTKLELTLRAHAQ